jgi:hypothetical protein
MIFLRSLLSLALPFFEIQFGDLLLDFRVPVPKIKEIEGFLVQTKSVIILTKYSLKLNYFRDHLYQAQTFTQYRAIYDHQGSLGTSYLPSL